MNAPTMTDYAQFVESKGQRMAPRGMPSAIASSAPLPPSLFDWQAHCVRWALVRGTAALFADTGLGKTAMQLSWADAVAQYAGARVLILAPLAVAAQTVREGQRIGVAAKVVRDASDITSDSPRVIVCNYDRLHLLDLAEFTGVVLDESSILKSMTGKTRTTLIESFAQTPFRLACTATPSPNDFDELGNHAEFLGVSTMAEMLARYFINDLGDTGTWRLKGYAEDDFWAWCASWAIALRTPADLRQSDGTPYDGSRYVLPPLDIRHEVVSVDHVARQLDTGELFAGQSLSATGLHRELRATANDRADAVARIVAAEPDDPWIIWVHTNYEADAIKARIPDAVEVSGSMTPDVKERRLNDFSEGRTRVLLTKPSIAGFGMNWQHCARMVFAGLSYSYEALYQALRRSWRFGQTRPVIAYMVAAESEGSVRDALKTKEEQHRMMQAKMVTAMQGQQGRDDASGTTDEGGVGAVDAGADWTLTNGDCVEVWRGIPDGTVDFTIYSPPFANLYVYSDDPRDMGNVSDDAEFFRHFSYLLPELYRATRPGRLMAVHVSQLPSFKWKHGVSGLRDFRGDVIRAAEDAGWTYHSEVCIWKDPVTEMQRTKAHGLLYKTIQRNASFSRVGMPDYLVVFRKWDDGDQSPVTHTPDEFSLDLWQRVASPVWFDVDQGRTLNVRQARDSQDEKHLCPLQLDVIERAIHLWSNPGDLVASPFTGIGSEGVVALQMGRRFVGAELKPTYWKHACRNLTDATAQNDLFAGVA
jgi:DNA modification methylase